MAVSAFPVLGALPPLAMPGETPVFSDDFNGYSHPWSGMGAASGMASIGTDPGGTGATVWFPSNEGDGTAAAAVQSTVTLPAPVDLVGNTISVYMRVRIDSQGVESSGNRFQITLYRQSPGNQFGGMVVAPGYYQSYTWRGASGTVVNNTTVGKYSYPDTTSFTAFKLQLTDSGHGTTVIKEFVYNGSNYIPYKVMESDLTPGVFDRLSIYSRNVAAGSRVYFDSVQVTTIPNSLARSQNADSDPAWSHLGNTDGGNNYGYSAASSSAHGNPGEIGGVFFQSETKTDYADTAHFTSAGYNLDAALAGSGRFSVANLSGTGGVIQIGHRAADPDDPSFIGLRIVGSYPSVKVMAEVTTADGAVLLSGSSDLIRTGAGFFSYSYDPAGGANAKGRLTLSLVDPLSVLHIYTRDLTAEDRTAGASFNAFGCGVPASPPGAGTVHNDVWLDEAVYSAGPETLWTTGGALMPAWGLYPSGTIRAGRAPIGAYSAWGSGLLTWVAQFPADGTYQVFIRRYSGTGQTSVTVDEAAPVSGGRGAIDPIPGAGTYIWQHLGETFVAEGRHHVDLQITGSGMLDAVLFTKDGALNPSTGPLPQRETEPTLRARRTYRDDSSLQAAAGSKGYVVSSVSPYAELLNDQVPASGSLVTRLDIWGAANQYVHTTFSVRALAEMGAVTVSLNGLSGPTAIPATEFDLRVVHLRQRRAVLVNGVPPVPSVLLPDLLLRNDREQTVLPPTGAQGGYGGSACMTAIPAHESRQFWLTVHVPPSTPAGTYNGTLKIEIAGDDSRTLLLPVRLQVLNVDLQPVAGYYSIYYPTQCVNPQNPATYVSEARYGAELLDQARHGINAATLYSASTLSGLQTELQYAAAAGMTSQPPVNMRRPLLTSSGVTSTQQNVNAALALGFPGLYSYGIDEPSGSSEYSIMIAQGEWCFQNGFHTFSTINSLEAYTALKDAVDRPVYGMNVFSGPDNFAPLYARQKGFVPISYWNTSRSFPLWFRAIAGLYNTRCGYLGTSSWAYQGNPNVNPYDSQYSMTYPDANGNPIPTLNWEAFRAGVDDVRYLQALDRTINAAQLRLTQPNPPAGLSAALANATLARSASFESIDGLHWEYIKQLKPETLDTARRTMADATVSLRTILNP